MEASTTSVSARQETKGRRLASAVGHSELDLGPYGLGASGVGRPWVNASDAARCLETAWSAGLRYFDVAPMYSDGEAELRLGEFLRSKPRNEYVVTTKVGRVIRPDLARDAGLPHRWVYDYSAEGIERSLHESLQRLGLDYVDGVFVHDPDDALPLLASQAWPALSELRTQGVVGAIGVGTQLAATLTRVARELDADMFLMAGRYTLLDTDALTEFLPLCVERGTPVIAAEALHGGLIEGLGNPHFNYRPVPPAIRDRVASIAEICHRHGVTTAAAALQFPLAHPAVDVVLTGPETSDQLTQNLAWATTRIPKELWTDLKAAGLLREDAPTP